MQRFALGLFVMSIVALTSSACIEGELSQRGADPQRTAAAVADGGFNWDSYIIDYDGGLTCVPGSCWCGPYNIYTNNCHNAANCGVSSGSTGILSCTGVTDGLGGHTVNYNFMQGTFPCSFDNTKTCGRVCLSEPQSHCKTSGGDDGGVGGQIGDGGGKTPICCWEQLASANHPLTADGEPGNACYKQRCGKQSKPGGGVALPPGEEWPSSVHYAASCYYKHGGKNNANCRNCCQSQASYWDHYINKPGLSDKERARRKAEKDEFLKKCLGHCSLDTGGLPVVEPAASDAGDKSCEDLTKEYESCRKDVMCTPRNKGANHFCYARCSNKYGAPHANQVDLACVSADPGAATDNYYDCLLTESQATCDARFPGMPPAGVSVPYIRCFYDCMRKQSTRICAKIKCKLDEKCKTCEPSPDSGPDSGKDAGTDAAKPDAAKADAANPDAAQPDTAQPDAATPDAAQVDAGGGADSGSGSGTGTGSGVTTTLL